MEIPGLRLFGSPIGDGYGLDIPDGLATACRGSSERELWLARLPRIAAELHEKWSLQTGVLVPYTDATCSWVAPVGRKDGSGAVLKIGLPHMEARDEARGLRFWAGDPTVQLLDYSDEYDALLLERCEPGTALREQPESRQDTVIAESLRRLWRVPPASGEFRHLSVMTAFWSSETLSQARCWPDAGLVREGLLLFEELARPSERDVLLATDLHAGNVLSATRMPWLVIDPKPFIGDPAYDATQHLFNCDTRLRARPKETIRHFADLLEVDAGRIGSWLFARAAAEPRERWDGASPELAGLLARDGVCA